ncbi:MAG: hypothetical protein EBY07_14970 [Actinobacteria bacterium]|nr:hypothetical protein [Actinomycetota bacterium]
MQDKPKIQNLQTLQQQSLVLQQLQVQLECLEFSMSHESFEMQITSKSLGDFCSKDAKCQDI